MHSKHNPKDHVSTLENKAGLVEIQSKFEEHWRTNVLPEIGISKLAEASGFLQIVFNQIDKLERPARILDVGCGDGVHTTVLSKVESGSLAYCGVDISFDAVRLASRRPERHSGATFDFQAGDALSLPYCSNAFDIVFSYGVIAYTGWPERAIDEMVRVCKPGGLVGVWVYPKKVGIVGQLFELARSLSHRLGRRWSRIIIYPIVLILPLLPVRSGINLFNSTWQQCVEVVEVNLLPDELDFYTPQDVLGWFGKRNLEVQLIDRERPVAVWARV